MLNYKIAVSCFCIVMFLCVSCPVAMCDEISEINSLRSVSKQLTLKYIDLNRFVLKYWLEADKQPKSRIWRYSVTQEVSPSCNMASNIIYTDQLGAHMTTPRLIHESSLRGGTVTSLVGYSISGAGSALEFAEVIKRAVINKKLGYDPISAEQHVVGCLKEIDRLIDQRDVVVNSFTDEHTQQVLQLEGKVVRRLRDYLAAEFLSCHGDMAGHLTYEGTYYFLDVITRMLTGSSSICAIKAFGQPKYAGPASILATLSSAFIMISPLTATAVGYIVKKHDRKRFLRMLNEQIVEDNNTLEADLQQLRELSSVETSPPLPRLPQRLTIYASEGKSFRYMLENENKQAYMRNKVAIQSNIFGPLLGGVALSQGILATTAYYHYSGFPVTQDKRIAATKLVYAGSIIGIPRNAASIGITAFYLARSLHYYHELAKKKKLPHNLIEQRLAYLDNLEKEVVAAP